MQFTFLDMTGKTLFIRDDAERAQWTQEEMSLELEFPTDPDKVISIGQRVFFIDPSTGFHQIYEVKQAQTLEPDHYQIITAENIVISELTDEHIDSTEVTDETAKDALESVLEGTLWSIGAYGFNPTSSADLNRGSVWQAVLTIKQNWNVYIEPRVFLASNGTITRYLDITSTDGVWNGVRLSINKNLLDPTVTFDDSEVVTALYGYGGTDPDDTSTEKEEINFANVVWHKTAEHPAKPYGQKYIEDPTATEAFGRNGRPRFGYYQNSDITDPDVLLQKTWESLLSSSKPSISITGSVADLYRLGYADQPIKLHDIAMVEVTGTKFNTGEDTPDGFKDRLQITKITTDLLDPTATTLTIGSYIPNIIYIQRETNEDATGTTGGSTNKSGTNSWQEFRTSMQAFEDGTGMQIRAVQNDIKRQDEEIAIQEAKITVNYNKITQEVTDRRNADNVLNAAITVEANRITQEVTQRQGEFTSLSSRITVEAGRITQEVSDRRSSYATMDSKITQTASAITAEVTRASAAEGQLSGRITVNANNITAEVTRATGAEGELSSRLTITESSISAEVTRATGAEGELSSRITVNAEGISTKVSKNGVISSINQTAEQVKISADKIALDGQTIANLLDSEDISVTDITADNAYVTTELNAQEASVFMPEVVRWGNDDATWQSYTARYCTLGDSHYFLYAANQQSSTPSGSAAGRLVTNYQTTTLYYIGWRQS